MLLREFLGIRRADETERSAAWIRSQQRADGTWANFHGGPGELSTTIEAYWALRLAGDAPERRAHARGGRVHPRAGRPRARARVHPRLAGAVRAVVLGATCPALPPEIILLPAWVPLNIYDFACWARQTIVALSLVKAHRPVRALPFDLDELRGARAARAGAPARRSRRRRALAGAPRPRCCAPTSAGRSRRCAGSRSRAPSAGSCAARRPTARWGGIQPPWVYSLIALHLRGYPLEHPVMRRGLEGLERFMVEDATTPAASARRPAEPAPGSLPVARLGHRAGDGRARRRRRRRRAPGAGRAPPSGCSARRSRARGDWAVARPGLRPAAGRSSSPTTTTPTSTTPPRSCSRCCARVDAAPTAARGADRRRDRARACAGSRGCRARDGGWGAFDADNTRSLVRELPFLDFGEVIDEPSADVTAHARRDARRARARPTAPAARRGVRWLLDQQEPDGSWFGRWGVNHVYGTGAARAGADRRRRRALGARASAARCAGSSAHQNEDGGWGEDPRSYDDPAWIGRGPSTASQTAWALLALHAAGERSPALRARRRPGWSPPSAPTAAGTSRSTPAPASPPTTTSTTTSTGSRSRSWRSGAACAPTPADGDGAGRRGGARRAARRRCSLAEAPIDAPCRRGGDGAGAGRELPRRQPPAAAPRARAPARALRLRAAGRRARRRGARATAWPRSTGSRRELDRAYAGRGRASAAACACSRRCASARCRASRSCG